MASPYSRETMRRILSVAQAGARKFAAYSLPATHQTQSLSLPQLSLSLPEPLNHQLSGLGVDDSAAQRISGAVTRAATQLKAVFESDFKRRCQELQVQGRHFDDPKFLTVFPATYSTIYLKTVGTWSSYILHQYIPRFLQARQDYKHRNALANGRRPFNQSAIPLLERSFSQNAFPSRLEKYELAVASQMEYKQVHVWFQNRRSRFRKEGKVLKRQQQSHVLLEQLENGVADALIPESSEDEDSVDPNLAVLFLSFDAPPHAFPSPYPTICSYDPFPISPGRRKLALPWLRTTQSSPSLSSSSLDMDHLTSQFSVMSISDPESTGLSPPSQLPERSLLHGYTVGFTTPCSHAPHPALLRRPRRSGRLPCPSSCTTTTSALPSKATSDRHRAWHTTHALSDTRRKSLPSDVSAGSSVTPTSPLVSPDIALRCKKRVLPRRVPKHPPLQYPSMQSPSSPTPSSTSITSRSPSSTSSTDADSPLNTPMLSHSTLHADDRHSVSAVLNVLQGKSWLADISFPYTEDSPPLADLPHWPSASNFLSLPVDKMHSIDTDPIPRDANCLTNYA